MFLRSGVIQFPLYIAISQKPNWIIASAEYVHCAERKFHQKKMKLLFFFFWVMNNVCQTSTPIWFCLSDIFWDLTLKPFVFCFDFGGGSKEKENRTVLQVAKIELL